MTIPAPVQSHIDRLAARIAEIERAVADEETQVKAFAEAMELARDRISVLTPDLERLRLEHGAMLFVVDKYESEGYWSKLHFPQIDPPAAAASAANSSPHLTRASKTRSCANSPAPRPRLPEPRSCT